MSFSGGAISACLFLNILSMEVTKCSFISSFLLKLQTSDIRHFRACGLLLGSLWRSDLKGNGTLQLLSVSFIRKHCLNGS